jgi:hypothetical protein
LANSYPETSDVWKLFLLNLSVPNDTHFVLVVQCCSTTKSSPGLGGRRKYDRMFLFMDGGCEVSPHQTTLMESGNTTDWFNRLDG